MKTTKRSGHTPAGMDRLKKNLMIENSLYAAEMQGIITMFEVAIIAMICGLMAVVEGLLW